MVVAVVIIVSLAASAMLLAVTSSVWAQRSLRAEAMLFAKERAAMERELSAVLAAAQEEAGTGES
jgi:hypothetical protein